MADSANRFQYIYKILDSAPPSPLPKALPLSDLDQNDGYIHLSTHDQVPATASRFFANHTQLWILKLQLKTFASPAASLGRIVWEEAGSHGTFPHLYDGDLGHEVIDEVLAFQRSDSQDWKDILTTLPA